MEEKGGKMALNSKNRKKCLYYTIPLKKLDGDFDGFMKQLYDNDIECMGVVHDKSKNVKPHCHIVVVASSTSNNFREMFPVVSDGTLTVQIPEVIAYLLHYSKYTEGEKYELSALRTNIDLKEYRNDILKHGISLS